MKLIFFLLAFFLVSIRVYFSWAGMNKSKMGESEANMVIRSDNFKEEIRYAGRFVLTDDETGFKSISPGGHFKFTLNEETVRAESNLQSEIAYHLSDGRNMLSAESEEGKKLIAFAVHQMVCWGFDAANRMERVYVKGGPSALLSEVDSMKMDQLKSLYLNRLLSIDSLSAEYMPMITKKIESIGSDHDKADFLRKISPSQLNNHLVADAFFDVLSGLQSDMDKAGVIQYLTDKVRLSDSNMARVVGITGTLGSDMDKKNVLDTLINRGVVDSSRFNFFLTAISKIGSDMDKISLYGKLTDLKTLSEFQWTLLMNCAAQLGSDMDKTNLLIEIAQKMPKSALLKETYFTAAKSIGNDMDYGRAVRVLN